MIASGIGSTGKRTATRAGINVGEFGGGGGSYGAPVAASAPPAPPPVDYSAIMSAFGGGQQVDRQAKATADYYAAHPNLAMPASTKTYLSQNGLGGSSPSAGSGSSGGSSGSSGGGSGSSAVTTNVSTPNPTINEVNAKQLEAFKGDMNTGNLGRASDIAIRDNAENERAAARQNAASRGVSGGGIEDIQQSAITQSTLANQTKARVGITNDAEARRAALGQNIVSNAATDENLQNQEKNLALNQQEAGFQMEQSKRNAELGLFGKVLDLFGLGGGGGAFAL